MKIRLDIGGEKGNAFYILGKVDQLCMDDNERNEILEKMRSGDYNNLLRVFKENFPFVELHANYEINSVDSDLYIIDNSIHEL